MKVGVSDIEHNQSDIPLKNIKVDESVVELVNWFNSFSEIYTIASCQGELDGTTYIMWFSLDSLETKIVLNKLSAEEKTTVSYSYARNIIVYRTVWPCLEYAVKRLEFYKA